LAEEIGQGGMGVVYRAEHALLRRPTAVKLLPPERAGLAAIARFEREVQITGELTHPNTVAVYDYGRTPEGVFYYAMEYLEGADLERLIEHDGPQPPARVRYLIRQAAASLAEAHSRGLIHRDVKPSNLIVCQRGLERDFMKVVDFGLARDFDTGGLELSNAGQLVGTPLYVSPEQIATPEAVGPASDLYGLGAVTYFLLAATPPFRGKTAVEVCAGHLHSPVEPPSLRLGADLPPDLERLVLACLAKDPKARPKDAIEFIERLDACSGMGEWTARDRDTWWRQRGGFAEREQARRG
jgi:serine/threonine protein kinase